MPAYPRSELEEMVKRWLQANAAAEKEGNWSKLADFYTTNAEYRWNMGHNQEYKALGRQEISHVALGYWMEGFEQWRYPYHDVIIDEERGTVIGFWKQVAPHERQDGTRYEVDGVCGSWFEYAGNFQWKWQRDFFDIGNVKALFFELAGARLLETGIKHKIHEQARGVLLPGVERLRSEPSMCTKLQNFVAMTALQYYRPRITDDPLGWGLEAIMDQFLEGHPRRQALLSLQSRALHPSHLSLSFRLYGAMIGAQLLPASASLQQKVEEMIQLSLDHEMRALDKAWEEHSSINRVMLAMCLLSPVALGKRPEDPMIAL